MSTPIFMKPLPTHAEAQTQKRLQAAINKLQNTNVPHLLRVISYLRICCSIIQELHPTISEEQQDQSGLSPYSSLMQSLCAYDAQWWEKCAITEGQLTSNDPIIAELLQPVHDLRHNPSLTALAEEG